MSISGKISIDLSDAESGGHIVGIHSSRRTDIARFLIGKEPHEAIRTLPVIFSICACAHAGAAAKACGPSELLKEEDSANRLIVLCENAREHLLRIFTSWGDRIRSQSDQIPFHMVMGLVHRMQSATGEQTHLHNTRAKLAPNPVRQVAKELDDFLKSYVFQFETQEWLAITSDKQLAKWAENTDSVAARFISLLYEKSWQSFGASQFRFLPEIPLADLADRMRANDGEGFIRQPSWQGRACETGPFARYREYPLVRTLVDKYGSGLLARQAARLVELAKIPSQIEKLAEPAEERQSSHNISGVGQIETARGQLTHCAIITGGKIADYRILAPTEWNFHPNGIVHDALKNLQTGNHAETIELAGMIVEALDPCVGFEVRVH